MRSAISWKISCSTLTRGSGPIIKARFSLSIWAGKSAVDKKDNQSLKHYWKKKKKFMRTTSPTSPEIMELFSKLAFELQTLTHNSPINQEQQQQEFNDSSIDPSISKLTLSLTHNPGVRVLDTALSLMCFKAPQVCHFSSLLKRNC
jgi:hypothetical protein